MFFFLIMNIPNKTQWVWGITIDSLHHLVDVNSDVMNEEDFDNRDYVLTNVKERWKSRVLFEFKKVEELPIVSSLMKKIDSLLERVEELEKKDSN